MYKKGLTLVEIIISLGIFTLVSVGMTGAVIAIMDGNKRTRAHVQVVDGLSFAIDSMARELRVGRFYYCDASTPAHDPPNTNNCPAGEDRIGFETSDGLWFVYRFNAGENSIERCGDLTGSCANPAVAGNYDNLTGAEVEITDLSFYVFGASAADSIQPRVVIYIAGRAGDVNDQSAAFNIQTSVTQRFPDI